MRNWNAVLAIALAQWLVAGSAFAESSLDDSNFTLNLNADRGWGDHGPGHGGPGHGGPGHAGPGHGGPGWGRPPYWHAPHWRPPYWVPAPPPPSTDYLCRGNFSGYFGRDRDAFLSLDDTRGYLNGRFYLSAPAATYNIEGGCEPTSDQYARFWLTLVPGGEPYYGTIYFADDGNIYMEGEQQNSGITFVLRRD